jgi:choice-of-anchor A domain-containing protein
MRRRTSRTGTVVASLAAGGLVLALLVAPVLGPAQRLPTAAAADLDCPPTWQWPPISGDTPAFADAGVAVLVGDDLRVEGEAAEAEGRVVVQGASTVDRAPPGTFNVGRVGAGSQVAPESATTMLHTGSSLVDDLAVLPGNRIEVGHQTAAGGDVHVGGVLDASPAQVDTNGGSVTYRMGPAATQRFADLPSRLSALSAALAVTPANGTVAVDWNRITFTGTGEPGVLQVFTLDASVLNAFDTHELAFEDIPPETAVVVNVRGPVARLDPVFVSDDGVRADDFASPAFPLVAVRTMWNYPDATSVHLAGSGQVLGSTLAMGADVRVTASTNGRVYVGGDLTLDGTHNELHNYHWPWSVDTQCEEQVPSDEVRGQISVAKELDGDSALLPADMEFAGTAVCAVPPWVRVASWRIGVDETRTLEGLTIGSSCTVVEVDLPAVPGVTWGEPVLSPGATVVVPDPADPGASVTVTVQNVALAPFAVSKSVVGPDGTDAGFVNPGRTFAVTYACTTAGEPRDGVDAGGTTVPGSASGTLAVPAGGTARSLLFPVGTRCTLGEDLESEPGDFDGDQEWSSVEIEPGTVVVGDPDAAAAQVVNRFTSAPVPVGTFAVTKSVDGPGGFDNPGRTFAVDYACTLDGEPTIGFDPVDGTVLDPDGRGRLDVGLDAPVGSPAFAVGARCTLTEDLVSEPDDFDTGLHWSEVEWAPDDVVTIAPPDAGGTPTQVAVGLVDRYDANDQVLTPFAVTKRVEGPDGTTDGFVRPTREFSITYACTLDGEPSTGYTPDGDAVLSDDGTGTLAVRAGETATSPSFVTGTSCVLREVPLDPGEDFEDFEDDRYRWEPAELVPPGPVTVAEGTVVEATAVNRFVREPEPEQVDRETFALTKLVEAPDDVVVDPAREFAFAYACERDGVPSPGFDSPDGVTQVSPGTGTLRVRPDETVAAPWFADGTTCTLSEEEGTEVTFSRPMPFELGPLEDEPVGIAATNVVESLLEPDRAGFAVAKVVSGPAPDALAAGLTFAVDFRCTFNGSPVVGHDPGDPTRVTAPEGTGRLDVVAGATPTAGPAFLTGSVCALSEDLAGRTGDFTAPGYRWTAAEFRPSASVVLTGTDPRPPVGIELVNTFAAPVAPDPGDGPPAPVDPTGVDRPLPRTGADVAAVVLLAVLLLAGGAVALTGTRRTRRAPDRVDRTSPTR